ncbi:MAG: hypothetical protein N2235_23015 [Fischerella sp.]|nr:hypothetical protein [Fischerella sp.]
MDWYNTFERYFRQISDLQRATFENWMSMTPSMQNYSVSNFRENINKSLEFQENLASNYLELQAQLTRMSVDIQKQFLEGYFKFLRSWW